MKIRIEIEGESREVQDLLMLGVGIGAQGIDESFPWDDDGGGGNGDDGNGPAPDEPKGPAFGRHIQSKNGTHKGT